MSEVKVYKGREGFITKTGHWVDSGFSEGETDNKNQEKPFLNLVLKSDYLAEKNRADVAEAKLAKAIEIHSDGIMEQMQGLYKNSDNAEKEARFWIGLFMESINAITELTVKERE